MVAIIDGKLIKILPRSFAVASISQMTAVYHSWVQLNNRKNGALCGWTTRQCDVMLGMCAVLFHETFSFPFFFPFSR